MKKFVGLFLAAIICAPIFIACNGKENVLNADVTIATQADSLNYAFGVANAMGIRQYVIGEDTADIAKLKDFCDGFTETFLKQDLNERLKCDGLRLGWSLQQEFSKGYLFDDSTITAKPELITQQFESSIRGEKWVMTSEEGQQYFMTKMQDAMQNGTTANLSAAEIDTMNMVLGMVNASMARKYMLMGDSTEKNVKTFIKSFKKGINTTDDSKKLYMEGMRVGAGMYGQIKDQKTLMNFDSIAVDLERIKIGLVQAMMASEKQHMTNTEATDYINAFMAAAEKEKNKDVIEKGANYLKENGAKEGVVTTDSGLQYEVITMGSGAKPAATDKVKVHYVGTLLDGTEFDSSISRGEPIEFNLNQVIKGWTEGVQLMPIGSKFRFVIPYELAYGEQGAGQMIGPCETLIFEVELLDIIK